ncbi:unnamed protein product [marine sediment metagenome]|uniref:Uncharacterized protein n=1 Tax=marine sediment metagenome TaxID=412755 RepID=X1IKC6_9ZZZZ
MSRYLIKKEIRQKRKEDEHAWRKEMEDQVDLMEDRLEMGNIITTLFTIMDLSSHLSFE